MSEQSPSSLLFTVIVTTPTKVLFQGEAVRISSENSVGPFDIYPHHTNFISVISSVLTLETPSGDKVFRITSGILRCHEAEVAIYMRENQAKEIAETQPAHFGFWKRLQEWVTPKS